MKEKTLRYPGHIDLIIALKEADFFSKIPIDDKWYKYFSAGVYFKILGQ